MKKEMIIFTIIFLLFGIVSAAQTCQIYDDFSSGSLDTDKWQEIPGSDVNSLFIDEHFVDGEHYHTAHLSPSDRGVTLKLKEHIFLPGEVVEYDVDYISGSGNRISIVDLDDDYRWLGQIGTWNDVGDDFGAFHFKVEFDNQGADVIISKPDGSELTKRLDSAGETHTFGFGTRTGHNGLVHMDYYNFKLCIEENLNCVPEGETVLVIPDAPECCVGLTKISPATYVAATEMSEEKCITAVGSSICSNCGNEVCESEWENQCNCEEDCLFPTEECIGESQSIPVIPNPPECCRGLRLIPPISPDVIGISGYCTAKCGDGDCNTQIESFYNCPEDCGEQECIDTDNGLNKFVKGITSYNGYDYEDWCAKGGESSQWSGGTADVGDVIEYACYNDEGEFLCGDTYCHYKVMNCPHGCDDGACIKEPGIQEKGYRYAYWQCYDGATGGSGKENIETTCKTHKIWWKYAKEFCNGHCNKKTGKCGVDSFSVSKECLLDSREIPEEPIEEPTEIEIIEAIDEIVVPDNPEDPFICKNSCPKDNKCYPFGYRKSGEFCFEEGMFVEQLKSGENCENDFECDSNLCVDDECISKSLIRKIIDFFRRLFGIE